MAVSDWLPTLSGTVLGLGGIYATLRAGKRQQETNVEVARVQAETQARLAREEREQRRLEASYADLMRWCFDNHGSVAGLDRVKLDRDALEQKISSLKYTADEGHSSSGFLLWSDAVHAGHRVTLNALHDVLDLLAGFRSSGVVDETDARNDIHEAVGLARDAINELVAQMRDEIKRGHTEY